MTDARDDASPPPADPPHWMRGLLLFFSGQTVSLLGSMLVQYAIFWYLTMEFRSGSVMMLAALFGFLPQAIVSIFGGVWADRHNRKLLIIAADGSIALTTAILAVLLLAGYAPLWLIFLTLAIRSAGAGIQTPAVSAMIPQISPQRHLMRVNGIMQTINSIMMLIAPAAAGAIFAWATLRTGSGLQALLPIFAIDVVTAVIGIALLALVRVSKVDRSAEEPVGYFADLAAGIRYVFGHAFVRWLLVLYAVVFLFTVAPSNLTPLMVVRTFPAGDEAGDVVNLTILELAFSIGMALGGILVALWAAQRDRITLITAASLAFAVLSIVLGLSPNVWIFFGAMFLTGLVVPFFGTTAMTLLQETVEPERRGRVFGFVGIVMALAMPVGMLGFGPLADVMPVEVLLVAAGIATIVVVAIALLIPAGRRAVASARAMSRAAAGSGDADAGA
ncbi:MFS transporter [Microbacterium sp. GXS0129]|uniref:MFS transporter n=1 Tax=Microbacterium sp. GXS0129 TaxID=3377836 RepID=UPI00383AD244